VGQGPRHKPGHDRGKVEPAMLEGLTINEAARTTGWSPRMLRYIESAGLIELLRTPSGYRIFGPGELQRLRTLRELLARFDCALSDVAFARRLGADPDLRAALDTWFAERPQRPEGVATSDWLHWEQEKHERLLALDPPNTQITENAAA
jgi:MerR family transcriptional regulator, copper efflux regulator